MAETTTPTTRAAGRGGPSISFQEADVNVFENSFSLQQTDRSPSGYTVYKIVFKVRAITPKGQPIIQQCATWKRFSDFQLLAKQLESIHITVSANTRFPTLVKANYFDRFKDYVIEERRISAEKLLQFTSTAFHLRSSIPFTDFLTGSVVERILPLTKPHIPPSDSSFDESIDTSIDPTDETSTDSNTNGGTNTTTDNNEDDQEALVVITKPGEKLEGEGEEQPHPYIRCDSVMVSEWGLEHTLKLRDDSKTSNAIPEIQEEENEVSEKKTTPTKDNDGDDEDTLPLPSTPVLTTAPSHKVDWWSKALVDGGGSVDDYDSLIEAMEKQKTLGVENMDSRRSSKSPSPSSIEKDGVERRPIPSANGEYILQAGKLITLGLECEKKKELEEAFDLFKAGVDVLLSGVQGDTSVHRREAVRKKTAEYLQYTEMLQKKLEAKDSREKLKNSNARPHLINDFKILSVIAKAVLLVQSIHTSQKFVFKVLHKSLTPQQKSQLRGGIPRSKNRSPTQCPNMVSLLHHYETQSNRIFLLLEYVSGGRLVQHVQSIRHPSSSKKKQAALETTKRIPATTPHDRIVVGGERSTETPEAASTNNKTPPTLDKANEDDEEMLLAQLSQLNPPPSHPVMSLSSYASSDSESRGINDEDSLTRLARIVQEDAAMHRTHEEGTEDGDTNGGEERFVQKDKLSELRRQLMESFNEDGNELDTPTDNHNGDDNHGNNLNGDIVKDEQMLNRPQPIGDNEDDAAAMSDLQRQLEAFLSNEQPVTQEDRTDDNNNDSSVTKDTSSSNSNISNTSLTEDNRMQEEPNTGSDDIIVSSTLDPNSSINVIPPTPTAVVPKQPLPLATTFEDQSTLKEPNQSIPIKNDLSKSPEFSPVVSLRGSPEVSSVSLRRVARQAEIEQKSKKWIAQIVKALDQLHCSGIICRDLHPDNVLITSSGDAKLTYFGKWDYVIPCTKEDAVKGLYVAPELLGVEEPNAIADWWSVGTILFEIVTGKKLADCHPGGIHSHIPLTIPGTVSPEATSLLQGLLQVNPHERLGAGMNGVEDIKSHPFFQSIEWNNL